MTIKIHKSTRPSFSNIIQASNYYSSSQAVQYRTGDNDVRSVITKVLKKLTAPSSINSGLDLGCGTGRYLSYINCSQLSGVDLSIYMLQQAENHEGKDSSKYKELNLYEDSITEFVKDEHQYDLIYSIGTLGYPQLKGLYDDTNKKFINNIYNCLSDYGIFFGTFSTYGFTIDEVIGLIKPVFNSSEIYLQYEENMSKHDIFAIGKKDIC